MSSKNKNTGNVSKKEKTSEQKLADKMTEISKVLKLNEEGLDIFAIASKTKISKEYVTEVIAKGAAEMEVQLRQAYGLTPQENITVTEPKPSAPETTSPTPGSDEYIASAIITNSEIVNLHNEGLVSSEIATRLNINSTYVDEVIVIGAAEMETRLRAGYEITKPSEANVSPSNGVTPEPIVTNTDNTLIDNVKEIKEQKSARVKKEKQTPKEKRTRENAILIAIKETNGTGASLETIGTRVNEILSINRKSWTGTLGQMKRDGEITYNKESKLYNTH